MAGPQLDTKAARTQHYRNAAAAAQSLKMRRIIMTISVAAITATGAWYGAGMAIKRDAAKVTEQRREATTEEKLEILDEKRAQLMTKKMGLERKLAEVEARKRGMSREESTKGLERKRQAPGFRRD